MTFDEEEALFENIKSGHNNNYLIADTTWRFFLKIEGNKLYRCHSKKVGWCSEAPGGLDEQFNFVNVVSVSKDKVILTLKDKTINIEVESSDASHYFGR
ncbi:hypothetical protein CW749_05545 [Vibrio sp. vnigr-6D03]|uniref:hypothetical protein n=1 Tax=Vibrio sp. vnigr-6D03 TaxID=2058088 RepID=UPI000C3318E3|nr:hypothetical protein [Vibrio sp. vnigr-6D03]PKF80624.1 hypothetical protein CW749_05545 [Vibrio sp. vnigr-6D03]